LTPDPLADRYPGWSPYNYVLGNPLRYVDPTGMAAEDTIYTAEFEPIEVWDKYESGWIVVPITSFNRYLGDFLHGTGYIVNQYYKAEGQWYRASSIDSEYMITEPPPVSKGLNPIFKIHPRVPNQLKDPRIGILTGRLTTRQLQNLANNSNALRVYDT